MKTGVVIDSKEWELAVIAASKDLKRALVDVYRDELGRVGKLLIGTHTPPKTKSQGLKAVRGDVLNTCTPVNEKWLNVLERQYGSDNASGTYRTKRGQVIRFAYARLIRTHDELHRYHKTYRHKLTGRTKYNPTNNLVTPTKAFVSKTLFDKYVKFLQRGIGMAKGGWWRAFRQVYTRRPPAGWITKQIGQGAAQVDMRPGAKQTFVAINRSPWANRQAEGNRAVTNALKSRAATIPKAVDREIKRAFKAKKIQVLDGPTSPPLAVTG